MYSSLLHLLVQNGSDGLLNLAETCLPVGQSILQLDPLRFTKCPVHGGSDVDLFVHLVNFRLDQFGFEYCNKQNKMNYHFYVSRKIQLSTYHR